MNFSGIIDNINFSELEAEKYWTPPKTKNSKEKKELARNFIFSGDYVGSRKKDGAYYRFIKDENGQMKLQGRSRSVTGDFLDKIDHVPQLHYFFNWLPNGTCLLGEIYFPEYEGSNNVTTIMGCLTNKAIQRQNDPNGKGKLFYYIFDIWAFNGKSLLKTKIEDRIKVLEKICIDWNNFHMSTNDYVDFATYYSGEKLWTILQDTLNSGGEGIVITKKNTIPAPGKRTAKKTLKVKKEIEDTIDVFVIGANPPTKEYTGKDIENWKYWYKETTNEYLKGNYYQKYQMGEPITPVTKNFFHNWAGSLKLGVLKDGNKIIQVGSLSGLTEEILSNWKDYMNKVMEISCMEVMSETLGFRHPKFIKWREDLTIKDATYEKIYDK